MAIGTPWHPDQFSSAGSLSTGLIPPVKLGWPLIRGWPGRLISFSSEIMQLRDSQCWDLSYTGEVVFPSEMEFCCVSNSSVLWWTTLASSGGLPLSLTSGNCRCFSPSVLALLPVNLSILVTNKFMIVERIRSLTKRFDTELDDVWTPYVGSLVDTLTECLSGCPTMGQGRTGLTDLSWLLVQLWSCQHTESCPNGTFDYPDWVYFCAFFCSCAADAKL